MIRVYCQWCKLLVSWSVTKGPSSALECLIGSCCNMSKYQQGADGIVIISYASPNI
jgi:hypothetical protein